MAFSYLESTSDCRGMDTVQLHMSCQLHYRLIQLGIKENLKIPSSSPPFPDPAMAASNPHQLWEQELKLKY